MNQWAAMTEQQQSFTLADMLSMTRQWCDFLKVNWQTSLVKAHADTSIAAKLEAVTAIII